MYNKMKDLLIIVFFIFGIIFSVSADEMPSIKKVAPYKSMLKVLKGMQKAVVSDAKNSSDLDFTISYDWKSKAFDMDGKYEISYKNYENITITEQGKKIVINGNSGYSVYNDEKKTLSKADIARYKRETAIQYAPQRALKYCSKIELDETIYNDDDDDSYYLLALHPFSYEKPFPLYVYVDTETFLIYELDITRAASFAEADEYKVIESYYKYKGFTFPKVFLKKYYGEISYEASDIMYK